MIGWWGNRASSPGGGTSAPKSEQIFYTHKTCITWFSANMIFFSCHKNYVRRGGIAIICKFLPDISYFSRLALCFFPVRWVSKLTFPTTVKPQISHRIEIRLFSSLWVKIGLISPESGSMYWRFNVPSLKIAPKSPLLLYSFCLVWKYINDNNQ